MDSQCSVAASIRNESSFNHFDGLCRVVYLPLPNSYLITCLIKSFWNFHYFVFKSLYISKSNRIRCFHLYSRPVFECSFYILLFVLFKQCKFELSCFNFTAVVRFYTCGYMSMCVVFVKWLYYNIPRKRWTISLNYNIINLRILCCTYKTTKTQENVFIRQKMICCIIAKLQL